MLIFRLLWPPLQPAGLGNQGLGEAGLPELDTKRHFPCKAHIQMGPLVPMGQLNLEHIIKQ